ncbi:MAG: PQQ-dependent sugar dehydrogenase, partial [Planctomycetota bacterium]
MSFASTRGLLAVLLLATACGGSSGPGIPFGMTSRTIVQGLNFPTDLPQPGPMQIERAFPLISLSSPLMLTAPQDGTDRIFVVQKGGRIVVFPNSDASGSATTFLDVAALHANFAQGGEMGLLSLAFDPNYATNGFFYVTYNRSGPQRSVISRFTVSAGDPNVANAGSELVLLTVAQPASNHNGGWMGFGPDDMLYLSLGDGGGQHDPTGQGQNLGTHLSSILRIDPHGGTPYGVPTDNPFVSTPGAQPEIWAYGFRNPWRCSFDRLTGDLWVGDVGQNDIEEVDLVRRGDNCGWRLFEGTLDHNNPLGLVNSPANGFRPPVRQHTHAVGRSVTGGYVYRGTANPSLVGAYVYADFTGGLVWAMVHDGNTVVSHVELAQLSSVAAFGEDEAGELYAVSLGGSIWRFRETGGGPPPAAVPTTLSATGLFSDTANLVPAAGLIEYEVNSPLWSDNARKRRWIALPGPSRIMFDATDDWVFPQGTVFVKHFELDLGPGVVQRLETRVLFLQAQGWTGVTYRWNASQTDAYLLSTGETQDYQVEDPAAPGGTRTQTWSFPSQSDCMS